MTHAPSPLLTPAQQHVVDRMRAGWALGLTLTPTGHSWLQQGGLGHGGPTEPVHTNTLHALYRRGVLQSGRRVFPVEEFHLTAAWREPTERETYVGEKTGDSA